MPMTAIEQVLKLAQRIVLPNLEEHANKIELRRAEVRRICDITQDLLNIEQEAMKFLTSKKTDLSDEIYRLEEEGKKLKRLFELGNLYPRLSLDPLTWRDEQGFPKLLIYPINSPTCWVIALQDKDDPFTMPSYMSETITKQYEDVVLLLESIRPKGERKVGIYGKLQGVLPKKVRKEVGKAVDFKEILVITEPKNSFVVDEYSPLSNEGLIVGYNRFVDEDALWLIAHFKTISVEEAMGSN